MKTLFVCFSPQEIEIGAPFCEKLGFPWQALVVPESGLADSVVAALQGSCEGFSHIVSVSSMRSKDVMARLAGVLDAAMVTDVIGIESPSIFNRPIIAGTVIETVETLTSPVVLTFRSSSFQGEAGESIQTTELSLGASKASLVNKSIRGGGRPDLSQAKRIVSGGRPLGDAETFERVIGGLADLLGGAVGATRAAVDSGIAANELQVGQTGKIVAPDLYIAAGISGSTQHMAGIKDSKCIVAINKDADAPIFEVADLGIVADLFEAIPALQAELEGS